MLPDEARGTVAPRGRLPAAGRAGTRDKEHVVISISEKTVKIHLNHIFSKLHIDGRFALALWSRGGMQPRA
jgi:hypothetical protein